MVWIRIFIAIILSNFSLGKVAAQHFFEGDTSLNKKRLIGVSTFDALAWGGSIGGLAFVWYSDYEKAPFHTFNDAHEWQQMDKLGHMVTSWNFARGSGDLFEWAGLDHKKSSLIGAGYSIAYMTTFELLDGFAADWGFSWADVAYNSLGSVTYWSQEFLWNHQYAKFKFSANNSGLASYRPEVLGNNFLERLFKDYNGQTYWMSFNPFTWFHNDLNVPAWINLSLGYGIHNQLYGNGDVFVSQSGNNQVSFIPYKQYYLSFDLDLEEIPVKKPWLKFVLRSLNIVKIPFPALEFSENGVIFKPLYF